MAVELVLDLAARGARARWRARLVVAGLSLVRWRGAVTAEEVVVLLGSVLRQRAILPGGGVAGRLVRRGRLIRCAVAGDLGVADAAATALLVGAVRAAAGAVPGVAERVRPAFGRAVLDLRVRCIWRLRLGDVILAGLGIGGGRSR